MDKQHSQQVLQKAAQKCHRSGNRMTDKRSRILQILLESEEPLSAYEVLDSYNATTEQTMPPMSAYRILDFLISEQLVHKLASENKFVACAHIVCCEEHKVPQFLICQQCHHVKEIAIKRDIIDELQKHVSDAGYSLLNTQLELECICESCRKQA